MNTTLKSGTLKSAPLKLTDLRPTPDDITGDVLAGLSQSPKDRKSVV